MSDDDAMSPMDPASPMDLEALDDEASQQIRKVMHEGRWMFSVIDVVGLLTDAPKPRMYWADMKRRIHDEGFTEVLAKCQQLKMPSPDGKQRLTDAADTETVLRIIQSIPSPKAEPFKQWLARVGSERLEEMESPERMTDRLRQQYRRAGYSEEWIRARLRNIMTRDELTDEWRERGVKEGPQYAKLTDIQHKGWSDITTAEHKTLKGLPKRANLRDNMTGLELALDTLTEQTAIALHQENDSQGFNALADDSRQAGEVGGAARRDVEARLGRPVVSSENAHSLTARAVQPELLSAPTVEPPGSYPEVVTVERVGFISTIGQQWAAYRDRSVRLPPGCVAAVGDRVTIYWRLPSQEGQHIAVRVNDGPVVYYSDPA